jgi:hypothetical protein
MAEIIELGDDLTRPPSLKLRAPGDTAVVAIVDQAEIPWTEFGTGNAKIGKDGRPRTQEVYTALVISGTGVVSDGDEDRPTAPAEVVSIYLAGHKRWNRVEAYKKLGRRVRVGDVWRWTYDHDERSSVAGQSPKKVHTLDARDAKPDEDDQTARCVALHRERKDQTAYTAPDAGNVAYGDEEPF